MTREVEREHPPVAGENRYDPLPGDRRGVETDPVEEHHWRLSLVIAARPGVEVANPDLACVPFGSHVEIDPS